MAALGLEVEEAFMLTYISKCAAGVPYIVFLSLPSADHCKCPPGAFVGTDGPHRPGEASFSP